MTPPPDEFIPILERLYPEKSPRELRRLSDTLLTRLSSALLSARPKPQPRPSESAEALADWVSVCYLRKHSPLRP